MMQSIADSILWWGPVYVVFKWTVGLWLVRKAKQRWFA